MKNSDAQYPNEMRDRNVKINSKTGEQKKCHLKKKRKFKSFSRLR
jgi:hypothetical protein